MWNKVAMFLAWKLPPRLLLWAVIRGFADATSGENGNNYIGNIGYREVYDSIVNKYKIKDM